MEFPIRCASGKVPPASPLITRRGEDCWTIELKTIDDLVQYVKQHGGIIIDECWWDSDARLGITIYDGCVE